MLYRRVMSGFVDRFGDLVAQIQRLFVFMYILGSDDTGRITSARGRDGIIERIAEIILKFDDRFGRES